MFKDGCSDRNCSMRFIQSTFILLSTAGISWLSTVLRSPCIPTCGFIFLPSSEGSISTCKTLAFGANASSLPVTRSSKRIPRAINVSDSSMAILAYAIPCIPGMPRFKKWSVGNVLMPSRVVMTGIWHFSANSITSL